MLVVFITDFYAANLVSEHLPRLGCCSSSGSFRMTVTYAQSFGGMVVGMIVFFAIYFILGDSEPPRRHITPSDSMPEDAAGEEPPKSK